MRTVFSINSNDVSNHIDATELAFEHMYSDILDYVLINFHGDEKMTALHELNEARESICKMKDHLCNIYSMIKKDENSKKQKKKG